MQVKDEAEHCREGKHVAAAANSGPKPPLHRGTGASGRQRNRQQGSRAHDSSKGGPGGFTWWQCCATFGFLMESPQSLQ